LANSYISDLHAKEDLYPLGVNLCNDCFHLQLSHTVNPTLIYKNYLYVSGTSHTLADYSHWFAKYADEIASNKSNRVLDIGCNDGSQLTCFKEIGYETWGVDPAENIYPASSKNHKILCEFFNYDIVDKIKVEFDIITAQNVFAHSPDPFEFLSTCYQLMSENTLLFIQTSQADMVIHNEFDTIYHEHVNYFNVNSMSKLAERVGINLIDVIKTPIHGNSYVFIFSKTQQRPVNIANKLAMESVLYNVSTYKNWEDSVRSNMAELKKTIIQYKLDGFKVIGYGAAAKGNTLLNYIDLKLDLIVDDNPFKQNLYTPGTHIPITTPDAIKEYKPEEQIVFIPLAWNFFKEISQRIKTLRNEPTDVFLTYFPKVGIVNV
jgi:SAM-dependent methyltransferase